MNFSQPTICVLEQLHVATCGINFIRLNDDATNLNDASEERRDAQIENHCLGYYNEHVAAVEVLQCTLMQRCGALGITFADWRTLFYAIMTEHQLGFFFQ